MRHLVSSKDLWDLWQASMHDLDCTYPLTCAASRWVDCEGVVRQVAASVRCRQDKKDNQLQDVHVRQFRYAD